MSQELKLLFLIVVILSGSLFALLVGLEVVDEARDWRLSFEHLTSLAFARHNLKATNVLIDDEEDYTKTALATFIHRGSAEEGASEDISTTIVSSCMNCRPDEDNMLVDNSQYNSGNIAKWCTGPCPIFPFDKENPTERFVAGHCEVQESLERYSVINLKIQDLPEYGYYGENLKKVVKADDNFLDETIIAKTVSCECVAGPPPPPPTDPYPPPSTPPERGPTTGSSEKPPPAPESPAGPEGPRTGEDEEPLEDAGKSPEPVRSP